MKKYNLKVYVIAVIIVLAIINLIAGSVGGGVHTKTTEIFSGGFLIGMLAMYIAMHFYKD
jgi:hypothetical protein